MKYEYIYIKQAKSGVIGHVYEHVIANSLESMFNAVGVLPVLDYKLDAYTYDGIVILFVEFNKHSLIDSVNVVLNSADLLSKSIEMAVAQVSCEYERLASFEPSAMFAEMRQLHALPWSARDDFTRTKPITDLARELASPYLTYGRYSTGSFVEYSIAYRLEDCPFELKPLAVYIIQMLAVAQIRLMYETVEYCYDSGDEWAEYQDIVGYSHSFRIPKNKGITIEEFTALEAKNRQAIVAQDFVHRLSHYILTDVSSEYPYFSTGVMFANSYQIIGQKGWQDIVTDQNIQVLLDKLTVDIRAN